MVKNNRDKRRNVILYNQVKIAGKIAGDEASAKLAIGKPTYPTATQ